MANLLKREPKDVEAVDPFDRFDRWFDEWMRALPFRWPAFASRGTGAGMIAVDEFEDEGAHVIRAELPGVDPEKDIELTVSDHMLRIQAERREEESVKEKGYLRREVRYGSFERVLPLPEGVSESDISADYKDGILEIRIPLAEPPVSEPTRITVTRD